MQQRTSSNNCYAINFTWYNKKKDIHHNCEFPCIYEKFEAVKMQRAKQTYKNI